MGVEAPARPVAEKKWLQPTGPLPRAGKYAITVEPDFDSRSASDGGCDSPNHFDGCRVIFIKVRTCRWMSMKDDSPADFGGCRVVFSRKGCGNILTTNTECMKFWGMPCGPLKGAQMYDASGFPTHFERYHVMCLWWNHLVPDFWEIC